MSARKLKEISVEEATKGVGSVMKGLGKGSYDLMSSGYQRLLNIGQAFNESPIVQNPLGRVTTAAYSSQAYTDTAHLAEHVENDTVLAIMSNKNVDNDGKPKSLVKRLGDMANYVTQKASSKSVVAGALLATKHTAAYYVGVAIGTAVSAAALLAVSPVVAGAAGISAGGAAAIGVYKGSKILLATSGGHWLEEKMAHGVKGTHDVFKKLVRADKGIDPEYTAVGKMIKAMEEERTHEHVHAHGHDHGKHHHHHHSLKDSLIEVGKDLGKIGMWTANLFGVDKKDNGFKFSLKNSGSAIKEVYEALDETVRNVTVAAMQPTKNKMQKQLMQEKQLSAQGKVELMLDNQNSIVTREIASAPKSKLSVPVTGGV